MAQIVLDTDVVSRFRAGRLPVGLVRQVVANESSIAFATAGELWRWALTKRWRPIESGLPLLTLNRRDFADFAEHDGLVLLGG